MDYYVIEHPLLGGRYELDEARPLNTHELGWIKRLTGYLPQELNGRTLGDPELIVALAAIAATRAGKAELKNMQQTYDMLASLPFDGEAITMESDEEDELPPTSETNSNGNQVSSGPDSQTNSETSETTRSVSGTPGLAASTSHLTRTSSGR